MPAVEQPLPTIPAGPPPAPSGWSSIPPSPGRAPPRSPTAGDLAGTTFRTFWRNAPLLLALGAVASLPMAAVTYRVYLDAGLFPDRLAAAQDPFAGDPVLAHWRLYLLGWLVAVLVWSAANAAAIHASAQALRGERVRPGRSLAAAFHRGPYVVAIVLLTTMAALATACTVVVPIVLMVGWCASLPSTVLEGRGPFGALARSWQLTRGHRWRLAAGFLMVLLPVAFGVVALQSAAMGIAFAAGGRAALGPGQPLALAMSLYQVIAGMLGMVSMVACAVAHHRLRVAKEGGDPVALGAIFD
jgi:hypothetical protein